MSNEYELCIDNTSFMDYGGLVHDKTCYGDELELSVLKPRQQSVAVSRLIFL